MTLWIVKMYLLCCLRTKSEVLSYIPYRTNNWFHSSHVISETSLYNVDTNWKHILRNWNPNQIPQYTCNSCRRLYRLYQCAYDCAQVCHNRANRRAQCRTVSNSIPIRRVISEASDQAQRREKLTIKQIRTSSKYCARGGNSIRKHETRGCIHTLDDIGRRHVAKRMINICRWYVTSRHRQRPRRYWVHDVNLRRKVWAVELPLFQYNILSYGCCGRDH